eukprot:237270-Rhodomonas_salina.1
MLLADLRRLAACKSVHVSVSSSYTSLVHGKGNIISQAPIWPRIPPIPKLQWGPTFERAFVQTTRGGMTNWGEVDMSLCEMGQRHDGSDLSE